MNYNITVIVPVLNERGYINSFLESLFRQDYPWWQMEVLFADGGSRDGTTDIIKKWLSKSDGMSGRILENKGKTAPCAMNLGISEASGEIIVRMDVHREYPPDYISKCVYYLTSTDADNVGCPLILRGQGFIGECIERVLTSAFGVGGSSFRKGNSFYSDRTKTEYVDTVPLGAFRKDLVLRLGGFDERYPRAEDNDFNYRIRQAGGKILLFKDIHTVYYCRSSIQALIAMGFGNGESVGEVFWKAPGTVRIRHLVPFGFVMSLSVAAIIQKKHSALLKAELSAYGLSCVMAASRSRVNVRKTLLIIPLFPALHFSYGIGTALGLAKGLENKVIRHDGH